MFLFKDNFFKLFTFSLILIFGIIGCAKKIRLNEYHNHAQIELKDYEDNLKIISKDQQAVDVDFKSPVININDISFAGGSRKQYVYKDFLEKLYESNIIDIKDEGESDYKVELSLDSTSSRSYSSSRSSSYKKYVTLSAKVINNKNNDVYFFSEEDSATSYNTSSQKAINAAIGKANRKLLNAIANTIVPQAKIINSKISKNDQSNMIFLINAGTSHGVVPQQKVKIFKALTDKELIMGEEIQSEGFIGDAIVTDKVSASYAWIVLENKSDNQQVSIADKVKLQFSDSVFKDIF